MCPDERAFARFALVSVCVRSSHTKTQRIETESTWCRCVGLNSEHTTPIHSSTSSTSFRSECANNYQCHHSHLIPCAIRWRENICGRRCVVVVSRIRIGRKLLSALLFGRFVSGCTQPRTGHGSDRCLSALVAVAVNVSKLARSIVVCVCVLADAHHRHRLDRLRALGCLGLGGNPPEISEINWRVRGQRGAKFGRWTRYASLDPVESSM